MKSALLFSLLIASMSASAQSTEPGSLDAAGALAKEYMATQFIVVGSPKLDGDFALVTVKMFDQECQLNMARTARDSANGSGWQVFGQVCGPVPSGEAGAWISDEQGKPRYVRPQAGG